jgi:hypothetical protein
MQTGPVLRRKRLGVFACPEANASGRPTVTAILAQSLTPLVTRLQETGRASEMPLKLVPFVGPTDAPRTSNRADLRYGDLYSVSG